MSVNHPAAGVTYVRGLFSCVWRQTVNSNSMTLRSELPGDEDAIDFVVCRAFGSMNEAHLVRMLRETYSEFDPRFSVVACDGDQVVGHALFTPARIRLMDETVDGLALGPIGVLPERQRQGIGGRMIRFGHGLGERLGFAAAFLAGHPSYYPQHGYRACFGFSKITIDAEKLPAPEQKLSVWPVTRDDLPWLRECQAREWADVDLAWMWGEALSDWVLPGTNTVIWRTDDGRRAGFTLRRLDKSYDYLLADDPTLARDLIATIKPEKLAHHPRGWLARNVLDPAWGTAEAKVSGAAMACELQPGALDAYVAAVESGERLPGCVNWPLPFAAC